MLFMVLEKFRREDPIPVYRRFPDRGRLAPEDVHYLGSWVTADLKRCYQVMECDDPRSLKEWVAQWEDLVEFEIIPVVTSAEALATLTPRL